MNEDAVITTSTRQPRIHKATAVAGSGSTALLILLLLAAFGLRTVNLYLADLTFDEVATVFVARRPLWEVIRYVMGAAREHPPFYYLLMSLWMQWVGVSEFAVRFPSVLAGMLTVAWGMKLGRRLFGKRQALWVAALFALAPFSVWAGRNGRMYALVMLLAIVIMERWLRWAARPDWRHGLAFTALSMIGAMTHYYLVLLWPVQGVLLLLMPRETRAIRKAWLAIIAALGLGVGGFIIISPGVLAMVLEVARRFPVRHFRANELRILVTELYIWGFRPEFIRAGLLGVGLTLIGWTLIWTRRPASAKLLVVWGLAPLILLHFVPEKLEARYLTPIFPALMLGLAGLLTRLPHALPRGIAGAALLWFCAWRAPVILEYSDVSFSTRVRILHTAVQPGDGLLMNGPWPSLLLTYYPPPEGLPVHAVPAAAPPGFSEEVDVPRLIDILDIHERLWVSYGAIQWADPRYNVSRWLAENAYCVFDREGLALYVRPADVVIRTHGAIPLSDGVRLVHGALDRHAAQTGDVVRVLLQFGGENLDMAITVNLALLDANGAVWQQEEFRLGPVHQPLDTPLPDSWREQRGFLIHPGIPPGAYTVALRVYRDGVLMEESHDFHGWVAVSTLGIEAGTNGPDLVRLLPHPELEVPVGPASDLSITAFEPHSRQFMQGYRAGFNLWWRVGHSPGVEVVNVRLAGPETFDAGSFRLGPSFYPGPAWQAGDIIRQSISFKLPDTLPAGTYTVQVKPALEGDAARGVESHPQSEAGWSTIASIHVEARSRQYHAPLLRSRRAGRFGDVLLLQGFQLGRERPYAGDQVPLTVYWKALERPDRLYAVFNHLRASDGTVVWQGDSWPQDGLYTTNHWLRGEVVAENYIIPLPVNLPPGVYTLYTGVYDPATGERLEATTTRGDPLINNELALFEWVIQR